MIPQATCTSRYPGNIQLSLSPQDCEFSALQLQLQLSMLAETIYRSVDVTIADVNRFPKKGAGVALRHLGDFSILKLKTTTSYLLGACLTESSQLSMQSQWCT